MRVSVSWELIRYTESRVVTRERTRALKRRERDARHVYFHLLFLSVPSLRCCVACLRTLPSCCFLTSEQVTHTFRQCRVPARTSPRRCSTSSAARRQVDIAASWAAALAENPNVRVEISVRGLGYGMLEFTSPPLFWGTNTYLRDDYSIGHDVYVYYVVVK